MMTFFRGPMRSYPSIASVSGYGPSIGKSRRPTVYSSIGQDEIV